MQIREYTHYDYPLLKEWFFGWDEWTPCDIKSIPYHTSFFVEEKGSPFLFSCYYKTNSNLAVLGFTIADPKAFKEKRAEATQFVLEHIKKDAAKNGFEIIYYSTDAASKHMVDHFVEAGATLTENNDAYIAVLPLKPVDIDFFACED